MTRPDTLCIMALGEQIHVYDTGSTREMDKCQTNRLFFLSVLHVDRNIKTDPMTSVLQGKVETKRKKDRPPTSYRLKT